MKTKKKVALVLAAILALFVGLVGYLWYESPYGNTDAPQTTQAISGFKNFKNMFVKAKSEAGSFVAPVEDVFSIQ